MKKSQIKELRSKAAKELYNIKSSQKEDLAKIMIDLKARKLKNTALVTNKKKMIAIISTILAEKEFTKV